MNMKNICQSWWLPSTYEFFRIHSMFNGRECSLKYICSFYCWSYVFWQGFCRAIHGHMLCTSAVLSLLLEEFWDRTSSEEKSQLAKIFDTFNLKITLVIVWRILCHGLKTRSLNYHLNLAPQRSGLTIHNTYQLHSSLSEQSKKVNGSYVLKPQNMLNISAATGHNNYAKTCWLYLQSATSLEKDHPHIFGQFMLGNHTDRRTEKNCSDICTDWPFNRANFNEIAERTRR